MRQCRGLPALIDISLRQAQAGHLQTTPMAASFGIWVAGTWDSKMRSVLDSRKT